MGGAKSARALLEDLARPSTRLPMTCPKESLYQQGICLGLHHLSCQPCHQSVVVYLLTTHDNTDYASAPVALASLPSESAERYRQSFYLGDDSRRAQAIQGKVEVPDHLFGCADASLSREDLFVPGWLAIHIATARRANRL